MTAYSFKKQFVKPILALTKSGTIRKERADDRVPPIGGSLQLYWAMRTKHCFRIGTAMCMEVRAVRFDLTKRMPLLLVNEARVGLDGLADFAKADGFETFLAMVDFWRDAHGDIDFRGHHIVWAHFEAAEGAAERAARL